VCAQLKGLLTSISRWKLFCQSTENLGVRVGTITIGINRYAGISQIPELGILQARYQLLAGFLQSNKMNVRYYLTFCPVSIIIITYYTVIYYDECFFVTGLFFLIREQTLSLKTACQRTVEPRRPAFRHSENSKHPAATFSSRRWNASCLDTEPPKTLDGQNQPG